MIRYVTLIVLIATFAVLLGPGPQAQADNLYYVKIHYQVQPDSTVDHWESIDYADLKLRPGMAGSAFVGNAGLTVIVATAGEQQFLVDLTLTTLPPMATVVTRQFVVDRDRDIEVTGLNYEIRYPARVMLTIHPHRGELECDFTTPDGARTVDEFVSDIPFHGAPSMINDTLVALDNELWFVDPSAHFEVYFVPNTLGDFAWNQVRNFLESEFQYFDNLFHLKRAQRIHFFISPCKVPEISWMPNRNWAIHPTTFKSYAVYNRDTKALSGVPSNLNYLYRYLGYAPLALAEGAARGWEYDHYYAKKLKWRGRLPRPSDWWPNIKYKSYPDSGLYIAAGSFVNYVIGTRGLQHFFKLYGIVNDFNADSAFAGVYGMGLRELEDEWLHYLDTVKVQAHIASRFVVRAKGLGRNEESIELLNLLLDLDTLNVGETLDQLGLLYFLEGRYEETVQTLKRLPSRYDNADRIKQMGNSALFFDGQVERARASFDEHLKQEKLQAIMHSAICLMYGWLEKTEGNFAKADSLLDLPQAGIKGATIDQIEIKLHKAAMRRSEGQHDEADSLYLYAQRITQRMLQQRPAAGDLYLRLGETYVGMGQADTALIYLDVAEFLEYRPYYVGRVLIAIGNAYDLLGMRDFALDFYREALEVPTSYPARVEARKYMREPYRVSRSS